MWDAGDGHMGVDLSPADGHRQDPGSARRAKAGKGVQTGGHAASNCGGSQTATAAHEERDFERLPRSWLFCVHPRIGSVVRPQAAARVFIPANINADDRYTKRGLERLSPIVRSAPTAHDASVAGSLCPCSFGDGGFADITAFHEAL